jgi:hypothetical protein
MFAIVWQLAALYYRISLLRPLKLNKCQIFENIIGIVDLRSLTENKVSSIGKSMLFKLE